MEEAVVVAARALRRHRSEDVVEDMATEMWRCHFHRHHRRHPEPADGFLFGVTLYNGMDKDTLRLPRQFSSVVDD
jgi:hypothetical protein